MTLALPDDSALEEALSLLDAWDGGFDWLLGDAGGDGGGSGDNASSDDGETRAPTPCEIGTGPTISATISSARGLTMTTIDPSSASSSPSTTATTTTTTAKGPASKKRRRNPRREEILYLRDKVHELEGVLETTKQRIADAKGVEPADVELLTIWEELANRQQKQRQRAEIENAKLRSMLESQVKVAKELMTLLQRQPRVEDLEEGRKAKRMQLKRQDDHEWSMEDQLAEVEMMYQAHRIFDPNETSHSKRTFRDVHVRDDDSEGAVMEVNVGWVMPFGLASVADAVWESTVRKFLEKRAYEFEEVVHTRDTHVADFTARAINGMLDPGPGARGRGVTRRYWEGDDHILIVSNFIVRPIKADAEDIMSAFTVGGSGTIRIVPFSPRSSEHSDKDDDVRLTRVIWQRQIKIQPVMANVPGQKRRVGAFTDFVLAQITSDLDFAQQAVEDVLVEGQVGAVTEALTEPFTIKE